MRYGAVRCATGRYGVGLGRIGRDEAGRRGMGRDELGWNGTDRGGTAGGTVLGNMGWDRGRGGVGWGWGVGWDGAGQGEVGRGGRGGAWREGRGRMGEGWVRGRRWDGRGGSYAAHLDSTRRRCRRAWTPRGGPPGWRGVGPLSPRPGGAHHTQIDVAPLLEDMGSFRIPNRCPPDRAPPRRAALRSRRGSSDAPSPPPCNLTQNGTSE